MRKKIAVYHPNLSTFGGGEFVCLSVALALAKDYDVTIFTNYSPGKEKLQNFFCVNLGQINIIERRHAISRLPILNSIKPGMILRGVYKMLEAYDLVIDTGTNGWFDKKLNCKTVCYVHFPLFYKKKKGIKKPLNYYLIKPESAFQYDKIICNSEFTKNYVSKQTRKPLEILYPPVNTKGINPGKKSKRIVTIGRLTYDKKHEIMIQAFKVFFDENKDLFVAPPRFQIEAIRVAIKSGPTAESDARTRVESAFQALQSGGSWSQAVRRWSDGLIMPLPGMPQSVSALRELLGSTIAERIEKIGPYAYRGVGHVVDQSAGIIEVLGFRINVGEVPCEGAVEFNFTRVDIR